MESTFLCYQDKDARDLMLQLSIYFALGALLMHVVFVVCTMVICRRDCTSVIISHIGILVILAVGELHSFYNCTSPQALELGNAILHITKTARARLALRVAGTRPYFIASTTRRREPETSPQE